MKNGFKNLWIVWDQGGAKDKNYLFICVNRDTKERSPFIQIYLI